jgi:hypothetical protein
MSGSINAIRSRVATPESGNEPQRTKMKTTIKNVTPEWAANILANRNIQNRHMSERVVEKYANDILDGSWCLTHQGIAFDENGDLLDGQHRLAAVVKAKTEVQMMVTTGIPTSFTNGSKTTSVFATIDGLKPRTNATTLELLKVKNSKTVASIARCVSMIALGDDREAVCISGSMTLEIVRFCRGSIEQMANLRRSQGICRVRTAGLAAIAFWHTTKPVEAEAFLNETQAVTGAKGSPSRALASWLSTPKFQGGHAQVVLLSVASNAIRHQTEGNKIDKIYAKEDSVEWLASTNRPLAAKLLSLFKL